ncbi:hypothetical protein MTO96_037267 [Rhipicephalus appendiculatus]
MVVTGSRARPTSSLRSREAGPRHPRSAGQHPRAKGGGIAHATSRPETGSQPAADPNCRRATGIRQAAPTQPMSVRSASQNIPNRRSLRHQNSPLQARNLPARLHELALQSYGCPTLRGSISTQVGAQANQLENTGHDLSSPSLRSGTRVHPQAGLHSSRPRRRRLGIVILVAVCSGYMPALGILSRALQWV